MLDPREHAEHRGRIESILRQVPGFRGYLEKEYRRESDELQRTWLSERLQRSKKGLDDLSRRLAEAAQLDLLPQIDRVRARLDKLLGRIRGAMQGYSGFFDLVQIDEEVLDAVYDHDAQLVEAVDKLAGDIEQLPGQPQPAAALSGLLGQIDSIAAEWDKRENILKGTE